MGSGERVEGWVRRHRLVADAGLAVALVLLDAVILLGSRPVRMTFPVLLAGPLVLRRTHPVLCLALVTTAALAQWLIVPEQVLFIADFAVPVAVRATAAHGPRWAGWVGLAAGSAGALLGALTWPVFKDATVGDHVTFGAALAAGVVAAWALGSLHRGRQERLAALTERARLLETERDQAALLAVASERRRIAREMHDVVSHSLSVMTAQADGGWYAATSSPEIAREALGTIGSTGRRAMDEMGRLLGVLREDPVRADGRGVEEWAPLPGLADLPELVERARAGGLDVQIRIHPPDLPDDETVGGGVGLVIYRIVQEALTNVLKHAGPAARVQVRLQRTAAQLEVEVRDDGGWARHRAAAPPPPTGHAGARAGAPTGGYGVIGMRERVAAYGGAVSVGRPADGGYTVHARIPMAS